MRKPLLLLFVSLLVYACTPGAQAEEEEVIPITETDVRFEFSTTEPNYDEVEMVFYDHTIDAFRDSTLVFNYDNAGNALPLILLWENHGFKYLRGEIYRNNFSPAELNVKIFVNDTEVYNETEAGTPNQFARIVWDYTID